MDRLTYGHDFLMNKRYAVQQNQQIIIANHLMAGDQYINIFWPGEDVSSWIDACMPHSVSFRRLGIETRWWEKLNENCKGLWCSYQSGDGGPFRDRRYVIRFQNEDDAVLAKLFID